MCRSRLVVREIKAAKPKSQRLSESEVFASMPPNEGLKLLMSSMCTGTDAVDGEKLVLAVFDQDSLGLFDSREISAALSILAGSELTGGKN